jgi:hypothetical protein
MVAEEKGFRLARRKPFLHRAEYSNPSADQSIFKDNAFREFT